MIELGEGISLFFEEEVEKRKRYVHGYIKYPDGEIVDLDRVPKNEGNFMYDKEYVYFWRFDREFPTAFNILDRKMVEDRGLVRQIINHYKSLL